MRKLFLTVAMVMAFSTVAFASTTPDTYAQISTASIDASTNCAQISTCK